MKKYLLLFLFFVALFNAMAQRETIDSLKEKKGFKLGFIVMKENNDTIRGLVNMHVFLDKVPEWVDFKTSNAQKKKPFRSDSISAFAYGDVVWRNFKYCGWAKLIIRGTIDVYKGYVTQNNDIYTGVIRMTCLAFKKKGIEGAKYIVASETRISLNNHKVLLDKAKDYFEEYISDNDEAVSKLYKSDFTFKELEPLLKEYNEWAKTRINKQRY